MSDGSGSYAVPPEQLTLMNPETWARMFLASASKREKFCAFCYDWSIILSIGIQFALIIFFLAVDPNTLKTGYAMNTSMSILLILFEFVQLIVIICAHIGMMKELLALYVRPVKIWNIYVSSLLCFSALYFTYFCYDRKSFNLDGYAPDKLDDDNPDQIPDNDVQTYNDIPTIFCFFIYFSGAIMTSTGFGDISPATWYSQMSTNCQMLIGTVYHVGVFGLTLAHFRSFQKLSAEEEEKRKNNKSVLSHVMSMVDKLQLAKRIKNVHPWLDTFRRFCVRHLALFSIAFQTLITLLLFAIPGDPFEALTSADGSRYQIKIAIIILMVVLQTFLFITVIFVSFRLVRAINNKDLSANFLVQSYIATALLFGGIYFILFAATPHHQFSRSADFDMSIFEVLYIFIHFSLTVMTTTGFGDIYARGVIARWFVLIEMLVSILYNAVIIGLGTSQLIDMQSAEAEQEFNKLRGESLEGSPRNARDQQFFGDDENHREFSDSRHDEDIPSIEPGFEISAQDINEAESETSSENGVEMTQQPKKINNNKNITRIIINDEDYESEDEALKRDVEAALRDHSEDFDEEDITSVNDTNNTDESSLRYDDNNNNDFSRISDDDDDDEDDDDDDADYDSIDRHEAALGPNIHQR